MHEVIFMILGPINQVATSCSSIPNPKKVLEYERPKKKRGNQRDISQWSRHWGQEKLNFCYYLIILEFDYY